MTTRLLERVRDRRAAALTAAEQLAAGQLGMAESIDFEERLDDFLRFDQANERLTSSLQPEVPVYRHGGPVSFFVDLARAQLRGDPMASERLRRHQVQVERRDVGSGAFAGLIPPVYLTELHASIPRAGRPFADLIGGLPLPEGGMELLIGKASVGTGAGAQTAENAALTETDFASSTISLPVRTVAGRQDISFQALDRGGTVLDVFLAMDLTEATWSELDRQLIAGSGSSGQLLGVLNTSGITAVAYTDATPTVPEFVAKLTSAAKQAAGARRLPPTAIVMHSRRFFWMVNGLDAATAEIIRRLPPVTIDDNIPTNLGAGTNEDAVMVLRPADLALLEGEVGFSTNREASAGTLTAVLEGHLFAAFTAARYASGIAAITGTGLIDPGTW